jgi:YHS domain-containing protein
VHAAGHDVVEPIVAAGGCGDAAGWYVARQRPEPGVHGERQFMGKPQIPVEVEGRTYYGCCAMCKDKLNQQPASRMAQDPVTGESVDKSKAVIVQDAQGKVKYFASEATLARYRG